MILCQEEKNKELTKNFRSFRANPWKKILLWKVMQNKLFRLC